jgi:hypothetical protein
MITTTHSHKHWTDKGGHVKGGEPSAPATPGLIPPSYTTCWDAADPILPMFICQGQVPVQALGLARRDTAGLNR